MALLQGLRRVNYANLPLAVRRWSPHSAGRAEMAAAAVPCLLESRAFATSRKVPTRRGPRGAKSMKAKGNRLEKRVVRLLKRLGKFNVQRSVSVVDRFGNRSEIDVIYGFVFKTYVECKNYSRPVPLSDVAKFKEVLALNGIRPSRGLFITNSTFVPRAKHVGIRTIDGSQLTRWEQRAVAQMWGRRIAIVWLLGVCGWVFFDGRLPSGMQLA